MYVTIIVNVNLIYHFEIIKSSEHQMYIVHLNVHSECRTSHFTMPKMLQLLFGNCPSYTGDDSSHFNGPG